MADIKIFAEGAGDVKFIKDYVRELYQVVLPDNGFDVLNSWSGYKRGGGIYPLITQSHNEGKQVILILDADNNFEKRQAEVLADFKSYNIPVKLFLFPNHSHTGCLEHLLCAIAVEQKLMQCFEAYEGCIAGYESPVVKSKIFAYLDALLPAGNKKNNKEDLIQDAKRDYRNVKHWDLAAEYLQPFHDFLSPLFIQAK
jgi:hypothetical protein